MAAAVFSAGRVTALLCSVPLFEMPPFVLFLKHTCVEGPESIPTQAVSPRGVRLLRLPLKG